MSSWSCCEDFEGDDGVGMCPLLTAELEAEIRAIFLVVKMAGLTSGRERLTM